MNQPTRHPLPPGTILDFCGERVEVVDDTGGNELTVRVDGYQMAWYWTYEGVSCTVISVPETT